MHSATNIRIQLSTDGPRGRGHSCVQVKGKVLPKLHSTKIADCNDEKSLGSHANTACTVAIPKLKIDTVQAMSFCNRLKHEIMIAAVTACLHSLKPDSPLSKVQNKAGVLSDATQTSCWSTPLTLRLLRRPRRRRWQTWPCKAEGKWKVPNSGWA